MIARPDPITSFVLQALCFCSKKVGASKPRNPGFRKLHPGYLLIRAKSFLFSGKTRKYQPKCKCGCECDETYNSFHIELLAKLSRRTGFSVPKGKKSCVGWATLFCPPN